MKRLNTALAIFALIVFVGCWFIKPNGLIPIYAMPLFFALGIIAGAGVLIEVRRK